MTSTLDLVVLMASLVVCLMLLAITALVIAETCSPPIRGRLEDIIEAASAKKKGPCP